MALGAEPTHSPPLRLQVACVSLGVVVVAFTITHISWVVSALAVAGGVAVTVNEVESELSTPSTKG